MPDALSVHNLTKTYPGGTAALRGVSLTVAEGDFFGLLGPNGAGKTTLISIATGLATPSGGTVSICGHDLAGDPSRAKACVGLVPQEINLNIFEETGNIVVDQAGYYGIPRPEALRRTEVLLRQLGLWDKRAAPSRTLSGGMKRRLMIARALVHRPRVLILDEPTAGVDIELRREMWDYLRKLNESGVTIILTTHYLEEAEQLCRNITIINEGIVVTEGRVRDLLEKLHTETFVFDTSSPVSAEALASLGRFRASRIDADTIEISLDHGQTVNEVVAAFTAAGIRIRSMRNKSNRLEELFLRLTRDPNL